METKYVLSLLLALWAVFNLIWSIRVTKQANYLGKITGELIQLLSAPFVEAMKTSAREEKPKKVVEKQKTVYSKEIENRKKDAVYSGVLHTFVRNGKKERPVMQYTAYGKTVFFEYDESGEYCTFKGNQKEAILRAMQGEKVRGFKKYEIKK